VAASRALDTGQAQALNTRYLEVQGEARDRLRQTDITLAAVGDLMQQVRTLIVQAGSDTLTPQDRGSIAGTLNERLDELIGLANSRDGAGAYLFSGDLERQAPYARSASGATYFGDQGRRELQVASGRSIAVTENGAEIFERARAGNGTFVTANGAANAGSAVVSVGTVYDPTLVSGHDYRIVFNVAGGVTTYDVVDSTAAVTLSSGNAYTPGGAIRFDGMELQVTGDPANGDAFEVAPAPAQNVFGTIGKAIAELARASTAAPARAQLAQVIGQTLASLDQAHEHVLGVRSATGSRLAEIDALNAVGQDLGLHYAERLSALQDVDYAEQASLLSRQQQALEAARLSFQRISQLTLFDYLK
jgi:flagellar hook-associated protein 3 FlgL